METKFTEQQSLALISEMIEQARNNFQKGSGNSMIFNGLTVSFLSLVNIVLILILPNPNQSFWIWMLMIPGTFITMMINKKARRISMRKTHIDSIISFAWIGFACAVCILLSVIFIIGFGMKYYQLFFLINPCIMIMVGLAEFITAKVCRFKSYFSGAFIMWTGAILCGLSLYFTNAIAMIIQFSILVVCMITGFVIPGYQLNKKAKENV
jgi:hypothetical protein